ncbi:MAG: DUF4304 domain-containing protein [Caulobacter sp.]
MSEPSPRTFSRQVEPQPSGDPPPKLEPSIRAILAPVLAEDGFSGSGRAFRRLDRDLTLIVEVGGTRYGGEIALSLSLQPVAVALEPPVARGRLTAAHCEFTRDLGPAENDGRWRYGPTRQEMDAAVAGAAETYRAFGRPFLQIMAGPLSPLRTATPQDFADGARHFRVFRQPPARMARTLAYMRLAAGDRAAAHGFARFALDDIGDGLVGSALVPELRAILKA